MADGHETPDTAAPAAAAGGDDASDHESAEPAPAAGPAQEAAAAAEYSGCQHYHRKCKMYCPECDLLVPCRLCHDELPQISHKLDRFRVTKIQCQLCGADQPPSKSCVQCKREFSEYYCDICHLWTERPSQHYPADYIWHCHKCGLCRKGYAHLGRSRYHHCDKCGGCWPRENRAHVCMDQAAGKDCLVCLEELHSSTSRYEMTECGHGMHSVCKRQVVEHGCFACPLCQRTFTSRLVRFLELQYRMCVMPPEYQGVTAEVWCNDCLTRNETPFNFVALRCPNCRSFNTRKAGGGPVHPSALRDAASAPDDA
eukprot:TRINITY_DN27130_c0_g1_i1.p1 TRINITY_DN27130_c0_g1~~TRINITY_DN27130_c0_g1_i1.p1  ORF type:complete len:332 (+),score=38.89 TRINITY_DN27130_c0_g1_i1:61-996(+)